MNHQSIFYTGGALTPEYPHYVLRKADKVADLAITKGKLIYTIAPRQMGKTSLLNRLMKQLGNQGWYCCFIDLATVKNFERKRWFLHLSEVIAHACKMNKSLASIEDQADFRKFLLRDIGLEESSRTIKLALFLDEVEGLLGLDFSDEFLMTLRDLYQQRNSYSGPLFIAFAGSVDPEILIKNPKISPFNIAEEIVLDEFSYDESLFLTSQLTKIGVPVDEAVHNHIHAYTAGQPYLTQRICEIIEDWTETQQITRVSIDTVDRVVYANLIAPRTLDKNVKHVQSEIANLTSFPENLWKRLGVGESIYSTEPGFYALYLTGAVTETLDGCIKIRNRIYELALKPQNDFIYDAFISYSHKDKNWVRNTLLPYCESKGLRICIDYHNFEAGLPSLVNIENAVEQSRKTLLVLTPDWIASEWANFEALLLQTKDPANRGRRLLPLMVKTCELPDRLKIFTYLDLTNPDELAFQMERMVVTIRSTPLKPELIESTHLQESTTPTHSLPQDFNYEHGLTELGRLLAQADVDIRLGFAVLESRLLENLQDERRYGINGTIRSERARIIQELNRLAITHLGRSFNDLCKA